MAQKLNFWIACLVLSTLYLSCLGADPQGTLVFPTAEIPPTAVINYMAERNVRLTHNLFHNIRMNWALLDELEQKQINDLGWKPAYVSYAYVDKDINQPVALINPNGEDFLYMHKQMVKKANELGGGTWTVKGWDKCPDPSNVSTEYPVPAVPVVPTQAYADYLQSYKTDAFYTDTIVPAEDYIYNTTNLQSITLGELGVILEYQLHTYFHVRWSAYNPIGYRLQNLHPTKYIGTEWDPPAYDYLADFYSAHVNPVFWKIHGWVETQIDNWATANNVNITEASWTSYWQSGPMNQEILDALAQVAEDAIYRAAHPEGDHTSAAKIVGSVFGGIVLGFIIAFIAFFVMLKMQGKSAGGQQSAKNHTHEAKPLKGTNTQPNNEKTVV